MSLGRKQRIDNSAWLEAVATIEEAVSRAELDELTAATVADIKATTAGKRAAYAWSAGKDSIVLGKLCEAAGVTDSMIGVCDLEYPAFAAWIEEHKPAGCEVIDTHQDIDWLVEHQEMLFPKDSTAAGRWFSIVQHRAQREYFKAHELDVIILGRRRADGNYVGRNSNIYTDGKGVTRFSPLAAWKHEHILAYIHYHQLPLPPIYDWKTADVWLYLRDQRIEVPEVYLQMYQVGVNRNQLRVSQFFSVDTVPVLVHLGEYDPSLMERVLRREPNAYLAMLYWDSEMFHRTTRKRRELEGEDTKDYRALLKEMLFVRPGDFFNTEHKRKIAKQYRKMFIQMDGMARPRDYKKMYGGLTAGDPKLRTLRAIYQDISCAYPDDTAPYFVGEMISTWILPPVEREVNL